MATATAPVLTTEPQSVEPDGFYEVVDGKVVEKPLMSAFESWLADELVRLVNLFDPTSRFGRVHQEMLFLIDRERTLKRQPDVAFVSAERWPTHRRAPKANGWDVIPDLAVEIVSPSNSANEIMAKRLEYFQAGVRLVWIVYPEYSEVHVYDSPHSVRILKRGDDLDGGAVLPGFRLSLSEWFGSEDQTASA
jgi:Uma2 family endonuclease